MIFLVHVRTLAICPYPIQFWLRLNAARNVCLPVIVNKIDFHFSIFVAEITTLYWYLAIHIALLPTVETAAFSRSVSVCNLELDKYSMLFKSVIQCLKFMWKTYVCIIYMRWRHTLICLPLTLHTNTHTRNTKVELRNCNTKGNVYLSTCDANRHSNENITMEKYLFACIVLTSDG